ncbi:alpha/beta fold hydrolase [Streptomyces sp. ITFR-6]|uniref:alpha/beta fold hydrolase n=1 Tax=Streptomyces sp. ITFR-6 TaxID=3075197 RepID=UPI00288A5BF0|nr:alpha/beta fold hydrolase [Streptomyces sp. ITFR-6]WNI28863.1 alpha/beta fold hydrolase [Streptomyces sp. ITFR-6]
MSIIGVSAEVSIAYESFGDPEDPPVLLVMGFGAQLLGWHEDFCRALADRGRHVIRYDNRDCGLSTKFDDHPVDMGEFIAAPSSGDLPTALAMVPYRLREMADDGLGLLSALGIERAHVVGASMGGMIAQTMALSYPERVLTLTSMMSSTGESEYGRSSPEAQAVLFAPKPADREGYVAAAEKELVWASQRYGSADALRELAAESYDRSYYPAGIGRQLGAMILSGSRADALRELRTPTLAVGGDTPEGRPRGGALRAYLLQPPDGCIL